MPKVLFLFILCVFFLTSCSEDDSPSPKNLDQKDKTTSEDDGEVGPEPEPPNSSSSTGPDPLFLDSWHLINTGQRSFARSGGSIGEDVGLGTLHLDQKWGEGLRIAVSDNGVELTHPELWPNRLPGLSRNYSSSSPSEWKNKKPTPLGERSVHAHGTSVSGLAVAGAQNDIGVRGLAPKAKFAGFVYVGVANSHAKMIDQAHGDFDIFNYSYGRVSCRFSSVPDSYLDQLRFGVNELRGGLGALYIKAAGNEFVGPQSDCVEDSDFFYTGNAALEREHSSPYMIVVGANNARGRSASYSTPGPALWLSAPGGESGDFRPALLSTDLQGCDKGSSQTSSETNDFESGQHSKNQNCDYTSTMNGTSAATPLVSAAVALILEENPSLTWREVKLILAQSARKIDPSIGPTTHPFASELEGHIYQRGWQENAAGFHFHNWYGFGALDTHAAVEAAKNYSGSLPKLEQILLSDGEWKYDSDELDLPVPDADASGVEHGILVEEELNVEAVQVRLSVEHTFASDLGVELTSPSGTVSQLMTINNGIAESELNDVLLLSNAFLGESSKGEWSLKVIDGAEEDLGVLKNWKINIWGHSPPSRYSSSGLNLLAHDESGPSKNENTAKDQSLNFEMNAQELKESQRAPALPVKNIGRQRKPSNKKSKSMPPLSKVLNSSGPIDYEWQTYSAKLGKLGPTDSKSGVTLLDFHINQDDRVDIFSSNDTLIVGRWSLESGERLWLHELSLPPQLDYAGSFWGPEKEELLLAARDSEGVVFLWKVEKGQLRPINHRIETNLLRRMTKSNFFNLGASLKFFVWDDYFLHSRSWQEDTNRDDDPRPIHFNGEKIEAVFENAAQLYVWTSFKNRLSLWTVANQSAELVKQTEVLPGTLTLLPLEGESFLGSSWDHTGLYTTQKEEVSYQKLPGFPQLSEVADVVVQDNTEGRLVTLWMHEKQADLLHQFKFYLNGESDEE